MFNNFKVETEQVPDENPDLYVRRAENFIAEGDLFSALIECDKAIGYAAAKAHYILQKIKILHHADQYEDCVSVIQEALPHFYEESDVMKAAELYWYYHQSLQRNSVSTTQVANFRSGPVGGGIFIGDWYSGKPFAGVAFYKNGDIYAGGWQSGKRHGIGTSFGSGEPVTQRWHKDKVYNLIRIIMSRIITVFIILALLAGGIYYVRTTAGGVLDKTGLFSFLSPQKNQPAKTNQYVKVSAEEANIRSTPDLNGSVVHKVKYAERLQDLDQRKADDEGRAWLYVKTPDGAAGWISEKVVEPAASAASTKSGRMESKQVPSNGNQISNRELIDFMQSFLKQSVRATQNYDFSEVQPFLDPSGESYKEQKDYLAYLKTKGIHEELVDLKVVRIETDDQQNFKVTTLETYDITYGDGSLKRKSFQSTFAVIKKDGRKLLLNALVETNEIK